MRCSRMKQQEKLLLLMGKTLIYFVKV